MKLSLHTYFCMAAALAGFVVFLAVANDNPVLWGFATFNVLLTLGMKP